nr:MAG TPA: intron associated endonuclease [Caudoviricetes sp.]
MGFKNNVYGYVYCIENKVNGKKYIGITTRTMNKRFEEHKKANSYIGNAIRKYGVSNFSISELDIAKTHEELCQLEVFYIEKFKTFENGYNLTIGGDGVVKDIYVDVVLNNRQKKFIEFVDKENEKKVDVDNYEEMIKSCLLNITYCYLMSDSKIIKRQSAKLILKLKSHLLEQVLKMKLFPLDEVRRWSEWQSTQSG